MAPAFGRESGHLIASGAWHIAGDVQGAIGRTVSFAIAGQVARSEATEEKV
jgi:hypothetical protein